MAFICPGLEEVKNRRDGICKLKNAIDKIIAEEGPVPVQMRPVLCYPPFCCCPPCEPGPPPCPANVACQPPEVMICYKTKKPANSQLKENKSKNASNDSHRLKESKSRELRAGILYIGCDCEKRNGLQDDCQRTECHGSAACLTRPSPTCGPSEFSNGKHLGKKSKKLRTAYEGGDDIVGGRNDGGDCETDNVRAEEYNCFPAVIEVCCPCP